MTRIDPPETRGPAEEQEIHYERPGSFVVTRERAVVVSAADWDHLRAGVSALTQPHPGDPSTWAPCLVGLGIGAISTGITTLTSSASGTVVAVFFTAGIALLALAVTVHLLAR